MLNRIAWFTVIVLFSVSMNSYEQGQEGDSHTYPTDLSSDSGKRPQSGSSPNTQLHEDTVEGVNAITPNLTLEQIKTNLINNPPNTGDPMVREESILALEKILQNDSSRTSQEVIDYYEFWMDRVKNELQDAVQGDAAIWQMYNHGYLIRVLLRICAAEEHKKVESMSQIHYFILDGNHET
ncbi:MAG: hypothetical protein ACE5OR_14390 [bacterium]